MSHKGDIVRLYTINKFITDIENIIKNHGTIEKAVGK